MSESSPEELLITEPSMAEREPSMVDSVKIDLPPLQLAAPAASTSSVFASLREAVEVAVEAYTSQLKDAPIRTKALTACAISILGEIIGARLKPRRADGTRDPLDARRVAVFAVYGLAITGPFFHWWYGALEKSVSSLKIQSSVLNTIVKVAITQLVMTPPFLLFTLAYIKYFISFDAKATVSAVRNTYAAALFTNWRVWTVAQAVNFGVVPLQYRVLFGNMVSLWWNIYLSLATASAPKR